MVKAGDMWRVCMASWLLASVAWAQAPGVPIETGPAIANHDVQRGCTALRSAGALLSREAVTAQLDAPRPQPLALPAAQRTPLAPRDIYARARGALVRLGWFFRQPTGDAWWLNLADGYALTADGAVATCFHVVAAEKLTMREGYFVAVTPDGRVWPVSAVLAADRAMDTAIVRVSGATFQPLPLNDQTAPGDSVWLLSDPLVIAALFTEGIINRFFWQAGHAGDAHALEGVKHLRLDVSCDWAPGSSGAAVLDVCGNCVGHVSAVITNTEPRSTTTNGGAPSSAPPLILHEAVPARGVMLLARAMSGQ